jgi:hypothetical protein
MNLQPILFDREQPLGLEFPRLELPAMLVDLKHKGTSLLNLCH